MTAKTGPIQVLRFCVQCVALECPNLGHATLSYTPAPYIINIAGLQAQTDHFLT